MLRITNIFLITEKYSLIEDIPRTPVYIPEAIIQRDKAPSTSFRICPPTLFRDRDRSFDLILLHPNLTTNATIKPTDVQIEQTDVKIEQRNVTIEQTDVKIEETHFKIKQTNVKIHKKTEGGNRLSGEYGSRDAANIAKRNKGNIRSQK